MDPTQNQQQPDSSQQGGDDQSAQLGPGESYVDPVVEQQVGKVMTLVFKSLNAPNKMRVMEAWLLKAPDLGVAIGHIAFKLLMGVFMSAKKAGQQLSADVFFAQGGAVYQTIDHLLDIAHHAGVPNIDDQKVRQDAMGIVMDSLKQEYPQLTAQGDQGDQGAPQGQPPQQGQPQAPPQGQPPQGQPGLMGAPQ